MPPSLLPEEQRLLLREINAGIAKIPGGTLDALGAATGDIVTVSPESTLGRDEIVARIDAVAAHLQLRGVSAGDFVACALEPGWEQVVATVAVARAGAVVVPLPGALAQVGRWQRLTQYDVRTVLTQSWLAERMAWPESVTVVVVSGILAGGAPRPAHRPSASAAWVAITDGPQPVAVSHQEIASVATELNGRFGIGPGDRLLAMAPIDSAAALYEIFGTWLGGATLVMAPWPDTRDASSLAELLRRERITVWQPTPTMLGRLLDYLEETGTGWPDALRVVMLGGELASPSVVRRLRALAGGVVVGSLGAGVVAGLWHTCLAVEDVPATWSTVPVGRPLANQRVFVLSETGNPCPVWVTGRLHIGGLAALPCVDLPSAEADSHPQTGEPLVRTERFARVLPDGLVEVVGDEAAQVMVHGRAYHLQDTEVALGNHEAVRESVVVPTASGKESHAFVSLRSGTPDDGVLLLDYLRKRVSPYLVPGSLDVLAELPVASDGSLARAAMAALVGSAPDPVLMEDAAPEPVLMEDAAPANDDGLLARLTRVACRALGVSDLEPNMNLLDVGATSMELVRLATLVEDELGIDVDVDELLRFPSVAVLASMGTDEAGGQVVAEAPVGASGPDRAALLTGIVERQAFKDAAHGTRSDLGTVGMISLPEPVPERILARRTHGRFSGRAVEFDSLAELLGSLRQVERDGEQRRWHPSAGAAYPVQTYVVAHPGRVRDLPAGTYYVHPGRNVLVPVVPGARLDLAAHSDVNRTAARQAAFTVILTARMSAITPLYADLSADFAMFEAGAIAQILMTMASEIGLGLCPVGVMDADAVGSALALDRDDLFLHALLGGYPSETR